jgi:hypothetical protein
MELVHSSSKDSESGWTETTIYDKYYYDRGTGQVTHIRTVDVDNPYKGERYQGKELINKVLQAHEIPDVVRLKIEELLDGA